MFHITRFHITRFNITTFNKKLLFIALISSLSLSALPALADQMNKKTIHRTLITEEHQQTVYHDFSLETGAGSNQHGDAVANWHLHGWIGSDENKFWLKSEGEHEGGITEKAEFWGLYSRNISQFWDAQIGIRYDLQPDSLAYGVIGFDGMAPYFIETEAHLLISEDGDTRATIRQKKEFLLTQQVGIRPYLEIDLFAQKVPELEVGSGISSAEFGIRSFYEITRTFAPYIDMKYKRKFGDTARIAESHGENESDVIATLGIKFRF